MNNDIIWKEEPDIMSFRLQSARTRKRMQRKDLEKKLFALHKEDLKLSKQNWERGWVQLNPPVMRGYKRYFVVRDDIARSKKGPFFSGILEKINVETYSSRKDFKVKKRKGGRKIYLEKDHQLLQPDELKFKKLQFTVYEAQFFEERYIKEKWMQQPSKIFVFMEPWRFVLRVRPNMITKTRVRDDEVERRIDEIDNFLKSNGYYPQLFRQVYGHYKRGREKERTREKNLLKNKQVVAILNDIDE